MVTSVVGVGIFALPLSFRANGLWSSLMIFLAVFLVVVYVQLAYVRVTQAVSGTHDRLIGYARHLAGYKTGWFCAVLFIGSLLGALTAYIRAGASFLGLAVQPFGVTLPFLVLVLFFSLLVNVVARKGMRFLRTWEPWIASTLLGGFGLLTLICLPFVSLESLSGWRADAPLETYGAVLFALLGFTAVPEMKQLLGRSFGYLLPGGVVRGVATVALLYIGVASVTSLVIVGTNPLTVLHGLQPIFGAPLAVVGGLLGVLTIFSVYTFVAAELVVICVNDLSLRRRTAIVLVWGVPLLLNVLPGLELGSLMAFTGAVFNALLGCLIIWLAHRIEGRQSPVSRAVSFVVVSGLLIGASLTIVQLF